MLHPPFDLNPNHGKLPPWCGCSTNTSIGSHPNPELPTSFPWTSAQKAPHKTHKHFVEEPDCFDSCQLGTPVWSYSRSLKALKKQKHTKTSLRWLGFSKAKATSDCLSSLRPSRHGCQITSGAVRGTCYSRPAVVWRTIGRDQKVVKLAKPSGSTCTSRIYIKCFFSDRISFLNPPGTSPEKTKNITPSPRHTSPFSTISTFSIMSRN